MNLLRSNVLLTGSVIFFAVAAAWRASRPDDPEIQPRPPGEVLAAGETVPGFWRDLGLREAPDGPVLVTFLTTECPWCRVTVPRWNRIEAAVRKVPGGAAVAVSLSHPDSTRTYPTETGLRLPLHLPADSTVERRWKVAAVPYTLLVHPSGRVLGVWRGALTDTDADAVVEQIHAWQPTSW
jgi:peroxiredoxin